MSATRMNAEQVIGSALKEIIETAVRDAQQPLMKRLDALTAEVAAFRASQPTAPAAPKPAKSRLVMMTLAEAARALHVSADWLYKNAKKRGIPHLRLGSKYLFRIEDLDAWMKTAAPYHPGS